jgi:hypothetical protein
MRRAQAPELAPLTRQELLSGSRHTTAEEPDTEAQVILTPKEASEHLWRRWKLQRAERRLQQLRGQRAGAGPPFRRDGNTVRYELRSLDSWAVKQLGPEHASTSAEEAFHQQRSQRTHSSSSSSK